MNAIGREHQKCCVWPKCKRAAVPIWRDEGGPQLLCDFHERKLHRLVTSDAACELAVGKMIEKEVQP